MMDFVWGFLYLLVPAFAATIIGFFVFDSMYELFWGLCVSFLCLGYGYYLGMREERWAWREKAKNDATF